MESCKIIEYNLGFAKKRITISKDGKISSITIASNKDIEKNNQLKTPGIEEYREEY